MICWIIFVFLFCNQISCLTCHLFLFFDICMEPCSECGCRRQSLCHSCPANIPRQQYATNFQHSCSYLLDFNQNWDDQNIDLFLNHVNFQIWFVFMFCNLLKCLLVCFFFCILSYVYDCCWQFGQGGSQYERRQWRPKAK